MDGIGLPADLPYCGAAPEPSALWQSWNFDPALLVALLAVLIYGLTRSQNRRLFLLGWCGLIIAFVSPLCALTSALFSARALHHLLLVSVIAPALAASFSPRAFPAPLALLCVAVVLVLWHLPTVYSAAWRSAWVYWGLQAALLIPAALFWSALFNKADAATGTAFVQALLVGALAGVMGLIGAVLTFSTRPLYPEHLTSPLAWRLDALSDQQLAGLVMWVPGLVPLAIVAALMANRAWQRGLAA